MTSVDDLHGVLDKDDWNLKGIKRFLNKHSVNNEHRSKGTPLLRVLQKKNCMAEVVRLLLKFGADPTYRKWRPNYTNCLNVALEFNGRKDIIGALLKNGAEIDNSSLCVALHCGAPKGVVELLLDAGCSTSVLCKHGSVLHCAVDNPKSGLKPDVLQLLIDRGADVRAQHGVCMEKRNILCSALQKGNKTSTIRVLMDAGASIKCFIHCSPFVCATAHSMSSNGHCRLLKAELVSLLIQPGTFVRGDTLHRSLQLVLRECMYEIEAIKEFLNCLLFLDPNYSYLHCAMENDRYCKPAVVELLIKNGVGVNKLSRAGKSALHVALEYDQPKSVIKALLENGADVNQKNEYGETPLHVALKYGPHKSVIKALMENGAEINQENRHSETPLHVALKYGRHKSVIKALLENGAKINQENGHGETPLNTALTYTIDVDIFEELYAAGAFTQRSYLFDDLIEKLLRYGISFARIKMLSRYFFLHNSLWDDNGDIFQNGQYSEALSNFRDECNRELQKMKSKQIGEDFTLHEFVSRRSSIGRTLPGKKYELDLLLKIFVDDTYPVYFSVISAKVGKDLQARASMEKMLEEVQVYTITYSFENPGVEKKIFLPYDIVSNIARFCTGDDLFRLVLSFFNPHGHPFTDQSSNEKKKNCKRKAECVLQCPKGPKSH